MIKNPIHLRLTKLSSWQLKLFMLCLCERMYPNFVFYCQQQQNTDYKIYKSILELNWESLLIKNSSINFDSQLEKLIEVIPEQDEQSAYSVFPAIDACKALSELVHSYLSGENMAEHAVIVSQISIKTVTDLELAQAESDLSESDLKENEHVLNELDAQWSIYRFLKEHEKWDADIIKAIKKELREDLVSNIGISLE